MSNSYAPEEGDQVKEQKSSQRLLLLILALLILVFAYLYFFTGLIRPRPQEEAAAPKVAPENHAVVKKPMPARPGEGPATETAAAAKEKGKAPAEQAKPAQPAAPAKVAQAPKPAPAATAKAAAPTAPAAPAAKPATPAPEAKPAKPAAADTKTAKAAPAEAKGGKPAAAAQAKAGKPAAPAEKGKGAAVAENKPGAKAAAAPKASQKEAVAEKGKPAQAKAKVAATGAYALNINGDLAESEVAPVMTKLKQAGITHVVKTKSHKSEQMHRLFLADFANHDEAQEELERLRLAAPEAFMLREHGRYAVYAGSYMREGKAAQEQDRLYGQGVKLLLKSATAPVQVVRMRAGSFAGKESAARAAASLKKAGLAATVVKVGK